MRIAAGLVGVALLVLGVIGITKANPLGLGLLAVGGVLAYAAYKWLR